MQGNTYTLVITFKYVVQDRHFGKGHNTALAWNRHIHEWCTYYRGEISPYDNWAQLDLITT
jgi:hypothetical protein